MSTNDWINLRTGIFNLVQQGYGPVLVRLAWHDAATGNVHDGTGGPHATILVQATAGKSDPKNAGLQRAIDALAPLYAPIQSKISNADLWSFAGSVAIKAMGGPNTLWRCGRNDFDSLREAHLQSANDIPGGNDPKEKLTCKFASLGLNMTDFFALVLGGHNLGAAYKETSGYGTYPWVKQNGTFSNFYFGQAPPPFLGPGGYDTNETVTLPDGTTSWQLVGNSTADGKTRLVLLPSDWIIANDAVTQTTLGQQLLQDKNKFFSYWQNVWPRLLEVTLDKKKLNYFVSTDFTDSTGLLKTPPKL